MNTDSVFASGGISGNYYYVNDDYPVILFQETTSSGDVGTYNHETYLRKKHIGVDVGPSTYYDLYLPEEDGTLATREYTGLEVVKNRTFTTDSAGWLTPTLKDNSSTILTSKNCLGIMFMHSSNSGTSSFVVNYYTFGKFLFNSSGHSRVQCTIGTTGTAVTNTSVTVTYGYIKK